MSRRLMYAALALSGLGAMGALYAKLTLAAAPPSAPAPAASAQPAPVLSAFAPDHQRSDPPTPRPTGNAELDRLEARRLLYENVDALLQGGELERARKLLDEEQARHGDDLAPEWRDVEQSYRLIADCLDAPTPRLSARARAFAEVSQAVALRPRILAACASR